MADLDNDDDPEICSTGHSSLGYDPDKGVLWQAYVLVWDLTVNGKTWVCKSSPIPGWESPVNIFPYLSLDVGELNGSEKVVVSANSGYSLYYLYLYYYSESRLYLENQGGLLLPDARIYDVEIGNVCNNGYPGNEVIVAGSTNFPMDFYLEVFNSSLQKRLWKRIGEGPKEGRVSNTAVVK